MKKISILALAVAVISLTSFSAPKPKAAKKTVVFCSTVDCEHCEKKVKENISFEKGVKDLSVDLTDQTVKIVFDESKTDTTKLANAIRKLGYEAKVKEYK